MEDEKELLDKLRDYPAQFELDLKVVADAKKLAEQKYAKGRGEARQKKRSLIFTLVPAAVCVLFLAIFLPVYLFRPAETESRYLNISEIELNQIDDISQLLSDHRLKVRLFDPAQAINVAAYIKDSEELVYITQELFEATESGFDILKFAAVFTNDEFEYFKIYKDLPNRQTVSGTDVLYGIQHDEQSNILIRLTFSHDGIRYFLEITTQDSAGKIEAYLAKLLA